MISPAASSLSPIALKYQIDLKNIIIETESDKK